MKESLYGIAGSNLIFRETFNSAQDTTRNGGTITGATFSNGVGVFNGTGYIKSNLGLSRTSTACSVRIKFRTTTNATQYLTDFRGVGEAGTGFVYLAGTTLTVSSGTRYVNGTASSTVSLDNSWQDVVVTGINIAFVNPMGVGVTSVGTSFRYTGDIELVEIYNRTLTATEVVELYNNRLYKEPNEGLVFEADFLNKNTTDKVSKNIGTNNGATQFTNLNGFNCLDVKSTSSQYISYNNINATIPDSSADWSMVAWFKQPPTTTGAKGIMNYGTSNGRSGFSANTNNSLIVNFSHGGSTRSQTSGNNVYTTSAWTQVILTHTSGVDACALYINGTSVALGAAAASGATATNNQLRIGATNTATPLYIDSLIGQTRVYNKVLSLSDVARLYNSQKKLYS